MRKNVKRILYTVLISVRIDVVSLCWVCAAKVGAADIVTQCCSDVE